jgi:hypothetical protein
MKIIIGNQTYESKSWDEPILASKKVKNKIVDLIISGNNEFKDFPELIILDKYKYQWILKGCKLVKSHTKINLYDRTYDTYLTISYESRSGSHIKAVIKGEIRDWNIDKLIG